jgi:hypothetical protein
MGGGSRMVVGERFGGALRELTLPGSQADGKVWQTPTHFMRAGKRQLPEESLDNFPPAAIHTPSDHAAVSAYDAFIGVTCRGGRHAL